MYTKTKANIQRAVNDANNPQSSAGATTPGVSSTTVVNNNIISQGKYCVHLLNKVSYMHVLHECV